MAPTYEERRAQLRARVKSDRDVNITLIASAIGRHRVYVSNVLSGRQTSDPVLSEVEAFLDEQHVASKAA